MNNMILHIIIYDKRVSLIYPCILTSYEVYTRLHLWLLSVISFQPTKVTLPLRQQFQLFAYLI